MQYPILQTINPKPELQNDYSFIISLRGACQLDLIYSLYTMYTLIQKIQKYISVENVEIKP